MTTAAYNSRINVTGTSTAMVAEAMGLVSGTTYQITTTARRLIDPNTAYTVFANAIAQPASAYVIDLLYGRVRFLAGPATPITITGNFLPLLEVVTAKEFSISTMVDLADVTRFKTGNNHEHFPTLFDADISLSRFDAGDQDYDPGAGNVTFFSMLQSGTPKVIEFLFGNTGNGARVACLLNKDNVKSAVGGVIDATVTAKLSEVVLGADISFSDILP